MKQQLPPLGVHFGKAQSWALCLLVLATLFTPAIIQMLGRSTDPSFIDNRPPAQFPNLPTTYRDTGKFRDGLIKYVDDNFGLRAELLQLDVKLHYWLGVSNVPGQLFGKDGWVFLKNVLDSIGQYRGLNRFDDASLNKWIDDLETYQQWLEANGIHFMVVVAPNKETIYPDYMPSYANRVWPQTRMDQVVQRLKERKSKLNLVDLRSLLLDSRRMGLLYNKYETHWNDTGGFIAYLEIVRRLKTRFPGLNSLAWSDLKSGTTKRKWPIPPITETVPTLTLIKPTNVIRTEAIESLPHDNKTINRIVTKHDQAPTLIIYGDSFSYEALLYPLQETFKWTIMINSNYAPFPVDLIKKYHPDIVIFELVERYLARPFSVDPKVESELPLRSAPPLEKVLQLKTSQLGGFVDRISTEGNQVHLIGWAVDSVGKAPAAIVYAYLGNRVVGAARMTAIRNDVTAGMEDHKAGFEMEIPRDLINQSPDKRLRIFSVNPQGRIYELNIYSAVLPKLQSLFNSNN